jgi:perosamine synthetase
VVTVSHSFIATANAITAVGARPIFVDIDPATYGMDPARLDAALTPATRAILCVHQLGFPCDLSGILDVAHRRALPIIEDAACAIGSEIRLGGAWQAIGRPHGLAACFSFHPRKVVTTGDGGMITTADPTLAERLRRLRQHAMAGDTVKRDSPGVAFESFAEPAYNLRMTDLQAALARPQLARLPTSIARRRALAERYRMELDGHRLLQPPRELPWMRANFQSYPLRLRDGGRLSQIEIMRHLLDRGVASRRGVDNAHMEQAYATVPWSCGPEPCDAELHRHGHCQRLRCSEEARDKTILIPLFHGMTEAEQAHVIASLQSLPA